MRDRLSFEGVTKLHVYNLLIPANILDPDGISLRNNEHKVHLFPLCGLRRKRRNSQEFVTLPVKDNAKVDVRIGHDRFTLLSVSSPKNEQQQDVLLMDRRIDGGTVHPTEVVATVASEKGTSTGKITSLTTTPIIYIEDSHK